MKTVIVTSDITYTPHNYDDVLESVLQDAREQVVGVVLVRVSVLMVIGKALYLYLVGCHDFSATLIKNVLRRFGRKKEKLCEKYGIEYVYTNNINNQKNIPWLKKIQPDLIVNMRARCIYKSTVLEIPSIGCVNVHHGLLPKQRGLFCDLHALGRGEETGFTIHRMTAGVDKGEIFIQINNKSYKKYMHYLSESALSEGLEIPKFVNQIGERGVFPESVPNVCKQCTMFVTPSRVMIKDFQRNGLIL